MSLSRLCAVSVVFQWLLFERQLSLWCLLPFQRHRRLPYCEALVVCAGLHVLPNHLSLCWPASLLWCFTGYHLSDGWCSRASLATTSATRWGGLALPCSTGYHFSDAVGGSWLVWLVGLAGWLVWLPGWAGCLAGLTAWLGWLAGCLG